MAEVNRGLHNFRWVAISQYCRLAIQLGSLAIFSRLLDPSDFGLFAMASVITSLGSVFQNMGTAAALIQKKTVTKKLLDTVFWFNIAFGAFVGAVVALTSPVVSGIFREPPLIPVLLGLALTFPIVAAGTNQLTLLERASRFKVLAGIEIASSGLGIGIAVIAALSNLGVYSLVIQLLFTGLTSTVLLWRFSDWRPRWKWSKRGLNSIWNFSINLVGFRVVIYLAANVDNILVGHFLGSSNLGWYSIACRIMLMPVRNLTYIVDRALFPLYSRQNSQEIASNYIRVLSLLSLAASPITFGLWSLRYPFVEFIVGEKYAPVADVLAWFAPLACLKCFISSTDLILTAIGRTDTLRNLGVMSSTLFIVSFVLGIPFGIVGIAKMYFLAELIVFFIAFPVVLKLIGLRMTDLVNCIWQPIAISAIMAVVITIADMNLTTLQSWQRFSILVPAGVAIYAVFIFLFARGLRDLALRTVR
jgi:O-antigen/teichoic acid export membrane protein